MVWVHFHKKIKITLLLLLVSAALYGQRVSQPAQNSIVTEIRFLLDSLWQNPSSFFNKTDVNWQNLCNDLQHINMHDLNQIKDSVFNSPHAHVQNKSDAAAGMLGFLNKESQSSRLKRFNKRLKSGFRDNKSFPAHKVVLIEGDSWFEYPLFLQDITDNLIQQKNLAVYSLASGGDWLANMISEAEYQEVYRRLKPDVFILSGGGNDIVGDRGIRNFVTAKPMDEKAAFARNYRKYVLLRMNKQPVPLCNGSSCPVSYRLYKDSMAVFASRVDTNLVNRIVQGRMFLNKNYYRWLVIFKLEFKLMVASLRRIDSLHFDSLKIITQGYDYVIPSSDRDFGMRLITKNGHWLKIPFIESGITDQRTQEAIIMAMIFDFNEMLIEAGKEFPNIYHVDARGFTRFLENRDGKKRGSYWYDEMHPNAFVFARLAKVYEALINDAVPPGRHVVQAIQFFRNAEGP